MKASQHIRRLYADYASVMCRGLVDIRYVPYFKSRSASVALPACRSKSESCKSSLPRFTLAFVLRALWQRALHLRNVKPQTLKRFAILVVRFISPRLMAPRDSGWALFFGNRFSETPHV